MQITLITLFNILIAIVCDSYDDALSRSDKTFWIQRMHLCAETYMVFKPGNYAVRGFARTHARTHADTQTSTHT